MTTSIWIAINHNNKCMLWMNCETTECYSIFGKRRNTKTRNQLKLSGGKFFLHDNTSSHAFLWFLPRPDYRMGLLGLRPEALDEILWISGWNSNKMKIFLSKNGKNCRKNVFPKILKTLKWYITYQHWFICSHNVF